MIDTIRNYLSDHEEEMLALLEELVLTNSHTPNKAGTDAVASIITKAAESAGFTVRREARNEVGDNIIIETAARKNGGRGVLLCGHMDTVFPPEMGFNTFIRKDNVLYGPGVADMKSGLVAGLYALKALAAADMLKDIPVALICNSDEETGSTHSSELIMQEAQKSDVALVMEGAGDNGDLIIGRKGRIAFELLVKGKAAHAGSAGPDKASAILELARQIQQLEALNDPQTGISLNVGRIEGGVGANTVAEHASAVIEFRYKDEDSRTRMWDAIQKLAAAPQTPGTECSLTIKTMRPSMPTNDAILELYNVVEAIGKELAIPVASMYRGGGSDANFIAQTGIPVLDGLGPIGGKLHTTDEYLLADTIVPRTLLAAVAIRKAFETYCK
ncbi:M20 family metallopeptidase [Desulfovibrio mangrovi]|uniref:M20 family metallopeptidase n=1 Tax=Desulfovibrio mangrovi TaxID=2976983 RepID=UPI0022460272|nr:M20 family metallopeptidase [Desulfovibrio mangrovi]UZP67582.1 M20 family metallopeptidase [Desulfovibrio mangrovi]